MRSSVLTPRLLDRALGYDNNRLSLSERCLKFFIGIFAFKWSSASLLFTPSKEDTPIHAIKGNNQNETEANFGDIFFGLLWESAAKLIFLFTDISVKSENDNDNNDSV